MTCQDIAHAALSKYADTDAVKRYNANGATLFCVDPEGEIHTLTNHPDVYETLELATTTNVPVPDIRYLGILTTGWAAPLDPDGTVDGAPSEHPERVRCMLLSVVDHNLDISSILSFENRPGELLTDPGEAVGSLADAMKRAMAVIRMKYTLQN